MDHFLCQQDKWHRVPCYTASGKLIRHVVHLSLKLTLKCELDYPKRENSVILPRFAWSL